jgi:hypothetical protein
LPVSFPDGGRELSLKTLVRRNWVDDCLLFASGAIPAVWAAARAPLAFDVAHALGAARTTGPAWTGAWRALDIAWSGPFMALPVGTRTFRAVLASVFALAALGVVTHLLARKLVPRAHPLLAATLATVGSLIATLASSAQVEGAAPAGSVLGALAILSPILFLARGQTSSPLGRAAARAPVASEPNTIVAAFALGVAASYELDTLVCALAALVLLRAVPPKRAVIAFALGALPMLVLVLAKGRLSPALAIDVRAFASPLGEGAGAPADLRELVTGELGLVAFALACGGGALVVMRAEVRRLGIGLLAIAAVGVALTRLGAPSGPTRWAPCVLAALCAASALAVLAMHELAVQIARMRVPYARASSVMVVVLLLALPMKTADDTSMRLGEGLDKTSAWSTDTVLPLAPHAAIVVDAKPIVQLLIALRASGELAPDITVVPTSDVTGRVASHAVLRDPALAPLARDLVLSGSPQEYALSAIATARPVFVAYDPRWDRALARHLLPQGAFDRFLGEPRGPSDRKRALDAFGPVRDRLAKSTRGDSELRRTTASLLRARALAVGAAGDKEAAKRTVEDLRHFAPSDPTGGEIVKRIVAADGPVDVADLAP